LAIYLLFCASYLLYFAKFFQNSNQTIRENYGCNNYGFSWDK
jgi:hypothetical protein